MGTWYLDSKKLKSSVKKLSEVEESILFSSPEGLSKEEWRDFRTILEAKTLDDLSMFSNEQIIELSMLTDRVIEYLSFKGYFDDADAYSCALDKLPSLKIGRRVL